MGMRHRPVSSGVNASLDVERVGTGVSSGPRGGGSSLGVSLRGVDQFCNEGGPHLIDSLVAFITHPHWFPGVI